MKFNKKLVVTSLSTVLGLGIVGSITGTIAWYQYSTRASASILAMSAGESGVLQISATGEESSWKRAVESNDFFTNNPVDETANNGDGVTMTLVAGNVLTATLETVYDYIVFDGGGNSKTSELEVNPEKNYYDFATKAWSVYTGTTVEENNKVFYFNNTQIWETVKAKTYNHPDNYRADNSLRPCTWGGFALNAALPNSGAYGNPIVGKKNMTDWGQATKATHYFQYKVYLKALNKGVSPEEQVARRVWATQIVLEDADEDHLVTAALRMHLDVWDGNNEHDHKYFLISNQKVSNLACSGPLDLDGDGQNDKTGDFEWDAHNEITYGKYVNDVLDTTLQSTYGINEIVATTYNSETRAYTDGLPIGDTLTSGSLQITVTIWLEGWAQLNSSAIWGPTTLDRNIHAGLKFDVGDRAFAR